LLSSVSVPMFFRYEDSETDATTLGLLLLFGSSGNRVGSMTPSDGRNRLVS
jgi:hypothetical protein